MKMLSLFSGAGMIDLWQLGCALAEVIVEWQIWR